MQQGLSREDRHFFILVLELETVRGIQEKHTRHVDTVEEEEDKDDTVEDDEADAANAVPTA